MSKIHLKKIAKRARNVKHQIIVEFSAGVRRKSNHSFGFFVDKTLARFSQMFFTFHLAERTGARRENLPVVRPTKYTNLSKQKLGNEKSQQNEIVCSTAL
jgi:hypothetical protein